jgi:hypothetical protein
MRPQSLSRVQQLGRRIGSQEALDDISKPAAAGKSTRSGRRSVASGIGVYIALIAAAYLLGSALPSTPTVRPLPTSSRTICKQPPRTFEPAEAQSKVALITGAAGFIGSHVARCAASLFTAAR